MCVSMAGTLQCCSRGHTAPKAKAEATVLDQGLLTIYQHDLQCNRPKHNHLSCIYRGRGDFSGRGGGA